MKKSEKKKYTRGRIILPTTQVEKKKQGETVDIAEKGLRLPWIVFIDEYIKNGGIGGKAYQVAYPGVSDETARANAPRLLAIDSVKEELQNKLNSQRCTDDWVQNKLMGLVDLHYAGKGAIVSEKALETLAKMKGLLTENRNFTFTENNPAVFASPISKEEKVKMDEESTKLARIVE